MADSSLIEAKRCAQLRILRTHLMLNSLGGLIPFTQRADLFLEVGRFRGDIARVSLAMASATSTAALLEFVLNPLLGKLSDGVGRKPFVALGPLANVVLRTGVLLAPGSERMLTLERVLGGALSTVAGTTCTIASLSDVLSHDSERFAKELGMLPALYGVGIFIGPLLGALVSKAGGPRAAFGLSAVVALAQLYNLRRLEETLETEKRKPFAASEAHPLSFLRLFRESRELLVLSVLVGVVYKVPEGKNLADLHQTYSRHDVGMSETARSAFVSFLGICIFGTAATTKFVAPLFGAKRFVSFCSIVRFVEYVWYANVPWRARKSWTMFLGLVIGCMSWSQDSYPRAVAQPLAEKASWGRGEFSAALGNMRALTAIVMPLVLGRVYSAYTANGRRKNPGAPYFVVALSAIVGEVLWRSLGTKVCSAPGRESEESEAGKLE